MENPESVLPSAAVMPATAVIVHFGEIEPTLTQVARVREWAQQIVVVANDGKVDRWFASDPAVLWVAPRRNLGYGGAANAALDYSNGSVIAILNTDIVIPAEAARDACRVAMGGVHDIVGLRMARADGSFLSGAGSLSRTLMLGTMGEPTEPLQSCEWVTGAAMFIARRCLERVRFDERYFLGMEDVDFCVRAREHGFETAVLNTRGVVHEGGMVIGSARWYYYSVRNPIWFLRTRRGASGGFSLAVRTTLLLARVVAADILKVRGLERSRLMARGIWDGVRLQPLPGADAFPWEPVRIRARGERSDG